MRIVVVDPSRTVLKAVSKLLESEGHAVTVFVDAEEALDFIKSEREVSVLITSVELSSMSGIELCWKTRLLSGCERTIYIRLMSSNSEEQHLINALDNGADELIRKPFASEELYARLRSAERLLRFARRIDQARQHRSVDRRLQPAGLFRPGRAIAAPVGEARSDHVRCRSFQTDQRQFWTRRRRSGSWQYRR
jgi:two-component system cell cycle response regulator